MRRRLLCEQRGAISILAGISLIFVIGSAAMTVDIGQVAWQKRSLQRVVDVVSLDAVRALGDRRDPLADPYARALQFAQQSATRNEFDWANTAAGNSLAIELGIADAATKVFTPALPAQYGSANAVRVTAMHRTDHHFMPGSVVVENVAIAMTESEATFSIGSRLASIDTTSTPVLNGVLSQMLGGAVNMNLLSYQGLAAGTVRLGAIWTQLGLGTSSQILNSDVTYRDFLTASAAALNNQGDPASVNAATILGTLATQVGTGAHFKFGDMLALASGDPGDAANAQLNVLQMIGMAASVANGTNLLNLALPITIPGVTATNLRMSVIEPPQIASGPARFENGAWVTRAHTAQVRIQMDLTLLQRLTVLLSQGVVHLPLYLEAAGADGDLTQIRCTSPTSNSDITVHTVTHAVSARVGTITDATLTNGALPADVRDAEIVNMVGLVRVTGHATATMPGSVGDLLIPLLQTRAAGGGSAGNVTVDDQLLASLALTVQVLGLGINANTVANNVLGILSPVLNAVDTTLLTPLKRALSFLGIEIGGADVSNLDEHCSGRRLIG